MSFTAFFSICANVNAREQVLQREVLRFTSSLSESGEAFGDSKNLLDKLCQRNGLICKLTAYPPGQRKSRSRANFIIKVFI